jgi:thiamine kinase-like enzyme
VVGIDDIPADCEFPQLQDILTPGRLTEKLQQVLGVHSESHAIAIEGCSVDRLYYKSGENCRLLLTAYVRHRATQELDRQILFGTLFRPSRSQRAYAALDTTRFATPKCGPAVMHLPEWEMILWAYPNDPHVPGVGVLADATTICALAQAAPAHFGAPCVPVSVTGTLTKYVPGMRCGGLYTMHLPRGEDHEDVQTHAVYGKAYNRAAKGAAAYRIMQQFWRSHACQSGALIIPQPYSYDADRQLLWQEALHGRAFSKLIETMPDLPEVAKEIGQRLAALHGSGVQLPEELTMEFQMEEVRTAVAALCQSFPEYAAGCQAFGHTLLATAERLGRELLVPVHGSFKFSHIFATPRGIAFIDCDGAKLGDPGYDLGRFISHLYRMQVSGKIAREVVEQTVTNIMAAYNQHAVRAIPQARILWFAASHMLTSDMYKLIKRMKPDALATLLDLAVSLCPA